MMPKKSLIQLSITVVLLIVLIFLLANSSKRPQHSSLTPESAISASRISLAVSPIPGSSGKGGNLYNLLEQQSKSIELKRDPFISVPIVSEKSLHPEISLTGILWDKAKPLAIIDGNVVKKGQRVGNKTIVEIKQDRVILSDGQIISEIRLGQ
jgi:hypothetical protein